MAVKVNWFLEKNTMTLQWEKNSLVKNDAGGSEYPYRNKVGSLYHIIYKN